MDPAALVHSDSDDDDTTPATFGSAVPTVARPCGADIDKTVSAAARERGSCGRVAGAVSLAFLNLAGDCLRGMGVWVQSCLVLSQGGVGVWGYCLFHYPTIPYPPFA